jgi:D-lyxose ketol-isomerase
MITKSEFENARRRALGALAKVGIVLTPEERKKFEVADFGFGDVAHIGLEIVTYINTNRYCAKELVLFPGQTCPEHLHPSIDNEPGKEETFRCRWGTIYLYVQGEKTLNPHCMPPTGREKYYTVHREVILKPGHQYTLSPNTLHWFQAGKKGAIVSEFSSRSRDEKDVFTDPKVIRATKIQD